MAEGKREPNPDRPNGHRKDLDCLRLRTTSGPPRLLSPLRSYATAVRGPRTCQAGWALSAPRRQARTRSIVGAGRLGNPYAERPTAARSAGDLRGKISAE